jgi:hypothetical protein
LLLDRAFKSTSAARFTMLMLIVGALGALFGFPGLDTGFNPQSISFVADILAANTMLAAVDARGFHNLLVILCGLLVVSAEVNDLIRIVLHRFKIEPQAQAPRGSSPAVGLPAEKVDNRELNRGRIIGILERAIVFGFVMLGFVGSVGFVLAAKALARFRELDDRDFAEYVLIGTLLSAGFALGVGLAFRALLI